MDHGGREITRTARKGFVLFGSFRTFRGPNATPAQRAAIEALVRKLLDTGGQGPQVAEWERELNALVYELYGLTEEEIAIVEGGH